MRSIPVCAGATGQRETKLQCGFSLIELLVAMAIGLFLVTVIGVLFVNSKVTYLAQDANSRVQENSRFGLELLGQQIRSAGSPNIQFTLLSSANLYAKPPVMKFEGVPLAGSEGASGVPDTVTVSFDSTIDCLGKTVTSPVVNVFRINTATKQLECLGNGDLTNAGAVLDDVEDLQVTYLQPSPAGISYVSATDASMKDVTAVRVCFLVRAKADAGKRSTGTQSQTYMDCKGASVKASDGYLRRSVGMIIDLRNRLS